MFLLYYYMTASKRCPSLSEIKIAVVLQQRLIVSKLTKLMSVFKVENAKVHFIIGGQRRTTYNNIVVTPDAVITPASRQHACSIS